jgi:hypothetical protein
MGLCQSMYGQVIVPAIVAQELRRPTLTCPAIEITDFPGFSVHAPESKQPLNIPNDLDAGETQALWLAMEMHADLILIDERRGTAAALKLGLVAVGVLGMLLEAKREGLIGPVLPLVDRLIAEQHFFVSPKLRQHIRQLAGE